MSLVNPHILIINSSVRTTDSRSASASSELAKSLVLKHPLSAVQTRELGQEKLPYINNAWVVANMTPESARTKADKEILARSDELIRQLKWADIIIFGVPMYNFTIPATLKTYIDLVCRKGETFDYAETGPVGLLTGKQAYICLAAGAVEQGSVLDHVTPYLRHILQFLGITLE